jgi:hypothetical protein
MAPTTSDLRAVAWLLLALLGACAGKDAETADTDGGFPPSGESNATDSERTDSADTTAEQDTSGDTSGDTSDVGGRSCDPLPPAEGPIVTVSPSDVSTIPDILAGAAPGDTIAFEDGNYALSGVYLWVDTPEVTLRSVSGDRQGVVLDGGYVTTEIITVAASGVTIADLTITRAYTHPIHVVSTDAGDTLDTLIYNVHIIDPREQAIKINPHEARVHFPDRGTIACSLIELTDEGRPEVNPTAGGCYTGGVDAHGTMGWTVRDNRIQGFFCPQGLAEHAIHFWRGARDTTVERNFLRDNARGVGFGLASSGEARTFDDAPCGQGTYVGHLGGVVRNNAILARGAALFGSEGGFDCGICFWSACGASALHNTIVSTGDSFSSIEWRFAGSHDLSVFNNLVTHTTRERDGAVADTGANVTLDSLSGFVDAAEGDLHLLSTATEAIDQGQVLPEGACPEDMDGDPRDSTPDIGADEFVD